MKVAMTLRNVKQKDLANALGVDRSSISQKMTRRVAWSLEDIEKASDFFHVKPEALVAGHGFEPWTSGYLFPGRFGGHVEESYIGDHISRLLPDGYAAHTLRHRFATTAYAATHDLFVVAELLGHESVETTEHYVAMPDGRLREATAAVRLI